MRTFNALLLLIVAFWGGMVAQENRVAVLKWVNNAYDKLGKSKAEKGLIKKNGEDCDCSSCPCTQDGRTGCGCKK